MSKKVVVKKAVRSTKGKRLKEVLGGQISRSKIKVAGIKKRDVGKRMDPDVPSSTSKRKKAKTKKNITQEIRRLYKDLLKFYKLSLSNAIEIGKLLFERKKKLEHGKWLDWLDKNLPFSRRSARNYISLYRHQAELKSARVADLNSAYKFLASYRNQRRDQSRVKTKNFRKAFADQPGKYKNPKRGCYTNRILRGDNNVVMKEMLKNGMAGKYSGIICSPPYNSSFFYGKDYNDDKPYQEHLKCLLKPFPLYSKLTRVGGRIIYIIGNIVKNKNRKAYEDYNHQIISDLKIGVRKVAPELRLYNHIIWDKGVRRDPLNKKFGTYANPKMPMTRCCHENILVWSNKEFELENIENTEPDITPEEFKEWAWSVWKVAPYVAPNNPHPCSFAPKLIERLLKFYFYPNDLILDPYAGVFVTGQVCKKLGRRYTGIELNKNYCAHASELLKIA